MRLVARLFAVAAALVAAQGCTQASTSLAGPSSSKCQITATNQPSSFPAGGGRGSVSIGATRDCAWAIAANAPWIAIAGERSGHGDGVVNYTVSENPVPSARSAALTIEDLQLPLSQAAATCTFSIAPADASVAAAGGTLSFTLTTLTGCQWSAASQAAWIAVSSPATRHGQRGRWRDDRRQRRRRSRGRCHGRRNHVHRQASRRLRLTATRASTARTAATACTADASPPPPPPPPQPPLPEPEAVEFEGTIVALTGNCPNVSFTAGIRLVVTNGGTEFRKGTLPRSVGRRSRQGARDDDAWQPGRCRPRRVQKKGDDD